MTGAEQPTFFCVDSDLRFDHPRLNELVRYWESKRRDGRLPARVDIDPAELKPFLGNIFMLDVVGEPKRFRYRLIGTEIVEYVGRDSTGKFQEEAYAPEQAAENNAMYRWICENKKPLRNFGVINWVGREFFKYEIVNLPLASDGDTVDIILGCMLVARAGTLAPPKGRASPA
ncbi:MAG TPA: PAS domain-containing protein [Stellaceae bacterium]|nr:PAS domain-containing protein [Stellaceae bacterium]